MRKLSLDEIKNRSTAEIIDGLRKREFSILQSLGCRKMRAEMNLTGWVCRLIVFLSGVSHHIRVDDTGWPLVAQKRIGGVLRKFAPAEIIGEFPHPDHGMAIGFNHPSLGEILRFIHISIDVYGYKRNLYPVNLPWYEALMPIANVLEACGIYILPIITPSTKRKMKKILSDEQMVAVESLETGFKLHYVRSCAEFIKAGDNIWVAPSATRQHFVFQNDKYLNNQEKIEPPTMSFLASSVIRSRAEACDFQAVAVRPPQGFGRGLNLFKPYRIAIGKTLTMDDARANVRTRQFEHMFLMAIAETLISIGGAELVVPYPEEETKETS